MSRNPAAHDDIFFKKHVRRSLWSAIVLGALVAVFAIYQFLSLLTLGSYGSYSEPLSGLVFVIGLGAIVFFYWRLHAKTQR